MKIFINTWGRAETLTTPLLLDSEGIPYTIIFHTQEQLDEYLKAGRIRKETAIVANMPRGLVKMRDWVLENLVEKDEWYLTLDDNITHFEAVPEPYYSQANLPVKEQPEKYKDLFDQKITVKRFLEICEESIARAEQTGAHLVGFASNVNFFFRAKKWREVGYVIGKTQLIKKSDLRYDTKVEMTDDYLWTGQNLERFGRVLINNYAVGIKKHYMKGGIGPYQKRLEYKLPEVRYLMRRFPGLFRFKVKKNHHPESEIVVAFTNTEQVKKWRLELVKRGLL